MGVNSLRKTVTRQRRGYDLNPRPSAPESSTLTTRLPSHHECVVLCKDISLQTGRFCTRKNSLQGLHNALDRQKVGLFRETNYIIIIDIFKVT